MGGNPKVSPRRRVPSSRVENPRKATGAASGLGGLYLARRDQGRHRAGQLSRLRLRDPLANHLSHAIGRGHYHCKHEPCWYVVRKGSTASWVGDHCQTTLWQIDKNLKSETGHGTQKPVECMRRPIENNASPGQAVYEPFSGSGTTIIAA